MIKKIIFFGHESFVFVFNPTNIATEQKLTFQLFLHKTKCYYNNFYYYNNIGTL